MVIAANSFTEAKFAQEPTQVTKIDIAVRSTAENALQYFLSPTHKMILLLRPLLANIGIYLEMGCFREEG